MGHLNEGRVVNCKEQKRPNLDRRGEASCEGRKHPNLDRKGEASYKGAAANRQKLWRPATMLLLSCLWMAMATAIVYAQSEVVAPADGDAAHVATRTFRPTADTYVDSAKPADSFATADDLLLGQINFGNTSSLWQTLLRFDLSSIPAGAAILDVELALFQSVGSRNAIEVNQIDQDWDATKTTWENQPQYTLADTWEAPPTTDEYITYSAPILTRVVQNWLSQPAKNYGLMLGPNASSDGRVFHSVDRRDDQPPLLRVTFVLPPIRVCDDPDCLKPTANAEVVNQTTGKEYASDSAGYVLDDGAIQLGDVLWARIPVERTNNSVRYLTSGEPRAVEAGAFVQPPDVNQPEMRLILQRPLLVRDLQVSTQWNLEGDPAYKGDLAQRIVDASGHFYRFTDGQFALGRVTVYQNYDRWDEPATDLWLHASNTMRPLSYIKGEVITPTLDPSPGVDFVYEPGHMYIGSHWNRYGAPPTQPLPPAVDASRDWAAALAHELGHYLLGQFDSYIAVLPSGIVTETFACTGSAMGWVYAPDNQAFVWDNAHWATACGNTLGAFNVKRTEWQTIRTWFEWAQTPETTTPYSSALPIPLTNVVFVPPAGPSPLVNQIFDLDYQNNELPSGEARAFLLRDVNDDGVPDRILDQGKPPQNVAPPQVTLTGAQESDRLCVIDIDTHIDLPDTPRHQFGCRVIQAGDSVLPMRREQAWAPVIQITPLATTQVGISVTQAVEGATVRARLYPEHDTAPTDDLALTPDADQWSGVFSVGALTPSAFVQVWVEEPATDGNPRREAIVDYGIGGGAVPGPKQKIGFAPVTSSDGKAFFLLPAEMSLTEDEFVAIQSMVGILPLPPATRLLGQAYRLIALPPSLVTQGSINVYLADGLPAMTTRTTAASASAQESRSIYFWDGSTWEKLPTTFSTADRGSGESEVLASAASRGVGVYAVLTEAAARVYLPSISR